jgi:hypothetical protein
MLERHHGSHACTEVVGKIIHLRQNYRFGPPKEFAKPFISSRRR